MNIKTNIRFINSSFFLLLFSMGLDASVFQSVLSSIAKSYNVSSVYMGTFVTIHFFGCITGSIISGELGDRIGKKKVILTSIVMLCAGIMTIYLINNLFATCVGLFIAGFGINGIDCMTASAISDVNKGTEVKLMNFSHALYCLGTIIGPLLVIAFVKSDNWRVIYPPILIIFVLLLGYTAYFRFGESSAATRHKSKNVITLELVRDPAFIVLCFAMFLYIGAEAGTSYWLGYYIEKTFADSSIGKLLLASFWGGMMVGRLVVGRFHKLESKFLYGGLVLSILMSVIWQFSQNVVVVSACIILIGFSFAPMFCAIITRATVRYSNTSGSASGISITVGCLGGAVIPFLMGVVTQKATIKAAFFMIPLLLTVLLLTLVYDIHLQAKKNSSELPVNKLEI